MAPKRKRSKGTKEKDVGAEQEQDEEEEEEEEVSFHPTAAKVAKLEVQESEVTERRSPNGFLLPDPLPLGFRLVDTRGGKWIVGSTVGCGGFGEIYATAREQTDPGESQEFVVKVVSTTLQIFEGMRQSLTFCFVFRSRTRTALCSWRSPST